jgi:patatin-related protein
VQDTDHRGLFEFDETDLARPNVNAALALAARSSASFPAAFEPAFLPHDKPYDQDDEPYEQDVAAQGRTLKRPAMQKYANITRPHWVADGGLLANRPINPLLQAIFDCPADRQVRRVLLYVVPSPGGAPNPGATPPPESPKAPLTLGEALLRDLGAVLDQSIAPDLRALRDHNDRVDSVRDTRRRMAELGLRLPAGKRLLTEQMLADYRSRQAAWLVRPVIATLMRALTTMPAGEMPALWHDALAPGGSAERDCRNATAAAVAREWPSLPEAGQYNTLAKFGRPAFDGAKATVLAMLRAAFVLVTSQQPEQPEQPERREQRERREWLASAVEGVHTAFTPAARPTSRTSSPPRSPPRSPRPDPSPNRPSTRWPPTSPSATRTRWRSPRPTTPCHRTDTRRWRAGGVASPQASPKSSPTTPISCEDWPIATTAPPAPTSSRRQVPTRPRETR